MAYFPTKQVSIFAKSVDSISAAGKERRLLSRTAAGNRAYQMGAIRRHLDLDDSGPRLNAVSRDKNSASVQKDDVPTNSNPI